MKEGWEMKTMTEVYDVRDGTHDSPKYQDEGYPLITSKNLKNGLITFDKIKYISEEDYININKRSKVDIGDVLFAMIGTIGNPTLIIDEPKFAIKNVALFKVDDSQSSQYLKYYLESPYTINKMLDDAKGSTQRFVGLGYLRKFPIPIPPLQEQKQIVTLLDKAFTAIDQAKVNIEKNIENVKELFQSKLNDIFSQKGAGWKIEDLGNVFTFRQGIQRGVKLQSEHKQDGQVRFVRIIDYTQGKELPRYIDNPGEQYLLTETDISLVRYGASTGFVCKGISGVLANNLFRVIPKDKFDINSDYLYYYLASPVFQRFIKSKMNGAAMPAISFGMISKISFPITSIENQINISKKIEEVEKQTSNILETYYQKIENLEELKKSILQKAFAGELTK